jgi:hypothetical protein
VKTVDLALTRRNAAGDVSSRDCPQGASGRRSAIDAQARRQGEMSMDSNRKAAVSAGVLFITATVASVFGTGLSRPLLSDPDHLTRLTANATQVDGGALLELIAAGASAGIAIAMYPVLQKRGAGLALGSVVFRTIEAVMYTVAAASLLSLLSVSRQFTSAGATDRAALQTVTDSLVGLREQTTLVGVLAFSLGALLYYWLFYRSGLIPRWLSGWGLAAIILLMVAWLLAVFTQRSILSYVILALPIAVQEMVLAVWLIGKGFSAPAPLRSAQTVQPHRLDEVQVRVDALAGA